MGMFKELQEWIQQNAWKIIDNANSYTKKNKRWRVRNVWFDTGGILWYVPFPFLPSYIPMHAWTSRLIHGPSIPIIIYCLVVLCLKNTAGSFKPQWALNPVDSPAQQSNSPAKRGYRGEREHVQAALCSHFKQSLFQCFEHLLAIKRPS